MKIPMNILGLGGEKFKPDVMQCPGTTVYDSDL